MTTEPSVAETMVRSHLDAFLEQRDVAAIMEDDHASARFCAEAEVSRRKQQIGGFFTDFMGALPAGVIERFALRTMQVDDDTACIIWSIGSEIPLATDMFVVRDGKTISRTFAVQAVGSIAEAAS